MKKTVKQCANTIFRRKKLKDLIQSYYVGDWPN